MRKIYLLPSLCLLAFFANDAALSQTLSCNASITSHQTAKKCVEKYLSSAGRLYAYLTGHGHTHLGNVTMCQTTPTPEVGSYFPKDAGPFTEVFYQAEVVSCKKDPQEPNAYLCYVKTRSTSQGETCYVSKGSGKYSHTIKFVVADKTAPQAKKNQITTFYPVED